MRCPDLTELPPPPPGKTGWPWTEVSPRLPEKMPDGGAWPKISIVTPSYNQGHFIEETIRSVLLQGYPDLEYIIMDGGSTDQSLDIIKKYSPWIKSWSSMKDEGQSDAINKALLLSTGDIVAWVNSDDYYYRNVFERVAEHYSRRSNKSFWLALAVNFLDEVSGETTPVFQRYFPDLADLINLDSHLHSAGLFWGSDAIPCVGYMRTNLHYGFDKEYWMRMMAKGYDYTIDNTLIAAAYRLHDASKTVTSSLLFNYEWTKTGLMYADEAGLGRCEREQLRDRLIYSAVRLSQKQGLSWGKRLSYLAECLVYKQTALFRRDWLGSMLNLLRAR